MTASNFFKLQCRSKYQISFCVNAKKLYLLGISHRKCKITLPYTLFVSFIKLYVDSHLGLSKEATPNKRYMLINILHNIMLFAKGLDDQTILTINYYLYFWKQNQL